MRRRQYFTALVGGVSVVLAGCSGDASEADEPECEKVADMGLPERESESFEVESGQYVRVEVNNNYGYRTHVVLRNPDGEVMFSEGVEDSGTWRVFDSNTDDRVVEESAGEWIAVYSPATDESSTSGDVKVYVCNPV